MIAGLACYSTGNEMNSKTIFLDYFATIRITSDEPLATLTRKFIVSEGYTFTIGIMSLIELYKWKKGWDRVLRPPFPQCPFA